MEQMDYQKFRQAYFANENRFKTRRELVTCLQEIFSEHARATIRSYSTFVRSGANTPNDYRLKLAIEKGKISRRDNEVNDLTEQDKFEENIRTLPNNFFLNLQDNSPNPGDLAEQRELYEIALNLIYEKLKERQREVVLSHYLENESFTYLGNKLNISRQMAQSINKRAISKIQRLMNRLM